MQDKTQLWNLAQKASDANRLPSECIPGIEEVACEWTIWQLDNAVTFFFRVIKNALLERVTTGNESEPKYTLEQLLDDNFRLPRPPTRKQRRQQAGVRAWAAANPGSVGRFKQVVKAASA